LSIIGAFSSEKHIMSQDLISRLRIRAKIRRQIPTRKSVLEGQPDRIADLLEEAAVAIELLLTPQGKDVELLKHCVAMPTTCTVRGDTMATAL
jgi:hypothetical protein